MIGVTGLFEVVSKETKTYGSDHKEFNEFVLREYKKEGTIKAAIFGTYLDMNEGNIVALNGSLKIRTWDFKGKTNTSYSISVAGLEVLKSGNREDAKPAPKPKPKPKPVPKPVVDDEDEGGEDVPF